MRGRIGASSPHVHRCRPAGGPSKARLDIIVREARRISRIHNPNIGLEGAAAGAILAQNSKTGGKWDIKNLRDAQGRKLYPKGQEFGDFFYGATSTGIGFTPTISDLGADIYSLWSNGTPEERMSGSVPGSDMRE